VLSRLVERGQAPERQWLYSVALAGAMTMLVLFRALQYAGLGPILSDFDSFYVVARLLADGRLVDAYDLGLFAKAQAVLLGSTHNLAWTYPPPFNLVIAPLAWVARPVAFLFFMGGSLAALLLVVRRLAGNWFAPALVLMLVPAFNITAMGQNGFLTGMLAGLALLGMLNGRRWAGVPLGLLIIKPHLAVGLAVYVVARRDWQTFRTAAATVALTLLVSTLLLGVDIWPAFFTGLRTTGALLASGYFPYYRMVSVYSTLLTLGMAPAIALAAHAVAAILLLLAIGWAAPRLSVRHGLALAGTATLLISPYAYDYDLMIAAAALALLMPDLAGLMGPGRRSALYAGFIFAAGYGIFNEIISPGANPTVLDAPPALASLGLLTVVALILAAVRRDLADPKAGKIAQAQ
jgi:hypothetical protein